MSTIERRIQVGKLALRSAAGGAKFLEGYAAKFGTKSNDLGGFKETIARGAFDKTLKTADVRCLLNHDPNFVLGRTKSKTLTLRADSTGLLFSCALPNTRAAEELHTSISRGDIDQCSFAFKVDSDDWSDDTDYDERGNRLKLRTLRSVQLFDVSAVTYPAYDDTSVSARALEIAGKTGWAWKEQRLLLKKVLEQSLKF